MSIERISVVGLILTLAAACHPSGNGDPEAAAEALEQALAPRQVRLTVAQLETERLTLDLVGEVRAFDTVVLSSEVAGVVDQVDVEVGDRVDRGDPLVHVDRSRYDVLAQRAEADLAAARANQVLAEKDLERKRDLLTDATVPQAAFDQAQAAHDLAVAQVAGAEAALTLATKDHDRSLVRAPAAGSITKRHAVAGQWAEVGVGLLELAIGDTVKVAARVPAAWVVRLSGLEGFDFTVGLSKESHRARLYSVDPVVAERSRSFEVVGIADNTRGQLRPGMFANVTLIAPEETSSLWVPAAAVTTSDLPQVMMVADGRVILRDIQIGRRVDDRFEVVDGLEDDELIIADVAGLARGIQVEVVE